MYFYLLNCLSPAALLRPQGHGNMLIFIETLSKISPIMKNKDTDSRKGACGSRMLSLMFVQQWEFSVKRKEKGD